VQFERAPDNDMAVHSNMHQQEVQFFGECGTPAADTSSHWVFVTYSGNPLAKYPTAFWAAPCTTPDLLCTVSVVPFLLCLLPLSTATSGLLLLTPAACQQQAGSKPTAASKTPVKFCPRGCAGTSLLDRPTGSSMDVDGGHGGAVSLSAVTLDPGNAQHAEHQQR